MKFVHFQTPHVRSKILPTIPRLITRIDESVRLAQIVLKQVNGKDERSKNALIIAASSIAAVRTAREQEIVPTLWAVTHGVDDSVRLAEIVLKRIEREE